MSVFDGLPGVFTGTFGDTVTISPVSGDPFPVTGILRTKADVDIADIGAVIQQTNLSLADADADLIAEGDQVTSGAVSYRTRDRMKDGRGMTKINLELI